MPQDFLTVTQAARYLGSHPDTLRRWDSTGLLVAQRGPGGHRRYTKAQLDRFMASAGADREFEKTVKTSPLAYKQVDFNGPVVSGFGEFVDLVCDICEHVSGYTECEIPDGSGDKGVDIRGFARGRGNKKLLVYVQCKRVRDLTKSAIEDELKKLHGNVLHSKMSAPDILIFATSSRLEIGAQDEISKLSQILFPGLQGGRPVFWGPRELSLKLLRSPALRQKYLFAEAMDKGELLESPSRGNIVFGVDFARTFAVEGDRDAKEVLEQELKRAGQLIELGELENARDSLLQLKGKLNDATPSHRRLLARVHNNLAVCALSSFDEAKTDSAVGLLNKALDYDPDLLKAKANLALAYLRLHSDASTEKAWRLVSDFPKDKDALDDPQPLLAYLNVVERRSGPKDAIDAYSELKEDERALESLESLGIQQYAAFLFLGVEDFEQARRCSDIVLRADPENALALYASGLADLSEAQQNTTFYKFRFIPEFARYDLIERAALQMQKAMKTIEGTPLNELRAALYYNWQLCNASLWNYRGIKLPQVDRPANVDQVEIVSVEDLLNKRDFSTAFEEGIKLIDDRSKSREADITRLAEVLLYHGAPEYSYSALQYLENNVDQISQPSYWQLASVSELLIGNTSAAIEASSKAVKLADDSGNEDAIKQAYSHHGAVLRRDPKDSDRLLETMLKYDEHFPEDHALQRLNFDKDKDFIVQQFEERRKWAQRVTEQYKQLAIPSYALEEILRRPYIEIWSGRGNEMPLEFTFPDPNFEAEIRKGLADGPILLDYLTLLTLAKLNMLAFLPRLGVKLAIHIETFTKMQNELIQVENIHLRRAWNFLRKTTEIEFLPYRRELRGDLKVFEGHFESWLLQTLEIAMAENYVLMTDDFRLLKQAKHMHARVTNSMALLKDAMERGWIDKKGYSVALGDLAEYTYTFLPYDSNDLHEIVWRDDYHPTLKSIHLISEMHLPGSTSESFIGVFAAFIAQIWRTGALSEDKVNWLGIVTAELLHGLNSLKEDDVTIRKENKQQFEEIITGTVFIWSIAVNNAVKEDLDYLSSKAIELFKEPFLASLLSRMQEYVVLRREQLDASTKQ